MLNKNPADRPANADELITALEHAKVSIQSGAAGQDTARMAAVAALAATGAGGGGALGALLAPESAPYPEPSSNGAGVSDDRAARRRSPPPLAAVADRRAGRYC